MIRNDVLRQCAQRIDCSRQQPADEKQPDQQQMGVGRLWSCQDGGEWRVMEETEEEEEWGGVPTTNSLLTLHTPQYARTNTHRVPTVGARAAK